jgi:hypothetical protein
VSETVTVLKTQIERLVEMSFRHTRWAKFQRTDGFFLVDAWFENGEPRMHIHSSAHSLEGAMTVQVAIGMAIEWLVEETDRGGNVPAALPVDGRPKEEK